MNGWEQNKLAEDKHYPKSVPEGHFLPSPLQAMQRVSVHSQTKPMKYS